jgi:hypothetical protein
MAKLLATVELNRPADGQPGAYSLIIGAYEYGPLPDDL